jgi:hypothetical protein
MLVRGHNKHGNGAGTKSDYFAELCGFCSVMWQKALSGKGGVVLFAFLPGELTS